MVFSEFYNLLHSPCGNIVKENGAFLVGIDMIESNEIDAVVHHRPISGHPGLQLTEDQDFLAAIDWDSPDSGNITLVIANKSGIG